MRPNPRDYDTPDDFDDAMNDYIAYMETMYDRIDMEIEKIKEDKLDSVDMEIEKVKEEALDESKVNRT